MTATHIYILVKINLQISHANSIHWVVLQNINDCHIHILVEINLQFHMQIASIV